MADISLRAKRDEFGIYLENRPTSVMLARLPDFCSSVIHLVAEPPVNTRPSFWKRRRAARQGQS